MAPRALARAARAAGGARRAGPCAADPTLRVPLWAYPGAWEPPVARGGASLGGSAFYRYTICGLFLRDHRFSHHKGARAARASLHGRKCTMRECAVWPSRDAMYETAHTLDMSVQETR